MVKFWEHYRLLAIKNIKIRIKHHEKQGIGLETMADKRRLQKMEEHHKRMMEK